MKIRYIYFEIYCIIDKNGIVSSKMQNENVLVIKPNTNSHGFNMFTNLTKRRISERCKVEQYWIDLEKYKFGIGLDNKVKRCLEKLKYQCRASIIEEILN